MIPKPDGQFVPRLKVDSSTEFYDQFVDRGNDDLSSTGVDISKNH
jgi:hypothetical protein